MKNPDERDSAIVKLPRNDNGRHLHQNGSKYASSSSLQAKIGESLIGALHIQSHESGQPPMENVAFQEKAFSKGEMFIRSFVF
ncbi:MAG: hypothetical protein M0022_09785 [Desulfobacteraceae bacterium]|nr:hypothetical protein [Desulfobacteraceae bacterium]